MTRPKNDGEHWSVQDIEILKKDASNPNMDTIDIAKKLGRTEDSVRQKAHNLHISLKPKDKTK